jgi:hypothetical protein
MPYLAIPIYEEGRRQDSHALSFHERLLRISKQGESDLFLLCKVKYRRTVLGDVYADDYNVLVLVLLVDRLQGGHLDDTWQAPGCPKVQHHDLAPVFVERFDGKGSHRRLLFSLVLRLAPTC